MNIKGQGALEYLLLIGGAVLVAAIVIALVTGIPGISPNPAIAAACAQRTTCESCILYKHTPGATEPFSCDAIEADQTRLTTRTQAGCDAFDFAGCVLIQ